MAPHLERDKPVLIIQHAPFEHPALILRALEMLGVPTQWIHPYLGESYPELASVRGVISLGGPMGANDHDEHPWIAHEIRLLRESALEGKPTAGVCLGGQMMAKALGGRVYRNEIPEIGWHSLNLSQAGMSDPILGAAGPHPLVYHWHNDTFELPEGALPLASSEACARQAYRIGETAYGFQFHPEADGFLVGEWLDAEGSADEIRTSQGRNGDRTIQSPETQRAQAPMGQLASAKISAGIAGLFENASYDSSVEAAFRESVEAGESPSGPIEAVLREATPRGQRIRGTIEGTFRIRDAEFCLLKQEETLLLLPVRLDRLDTIRRV